MKGRRRAHPPARRVVVIAKRDASEGLRIADEMAAWLRDPQAVKPGSLMKLPRQLTEDEISALVAYLRAHR